MDPLNIQYSQPSGSTLQASLITFSSYCSWQMSAHSRHFTARNGGSTGWEDCSPSPIMQRRTEIAHLPSASWGLISIDKLRHGHAWVNPPTSPVPHFLLMHIMQNLQHCWTWHKLI